jgi:4-hydroxy-4-methyl-2-oxoglutarate aldolase
MHSWSRPTAPGSTAPFSSLSTALVADACVRRGIDLRIGPVGLGPIAAVGMIGGRVLPAQHAGSVDVFLEAIDGSQPGDILVIDNSGSLTEGCIGDLIALEAQAAGLAGIVVWGANRDTAELQVIGLPIFSLGRCPAGPRRADPRQPDALSVARVGEHLVSADDSVFGDDDGVIFVASDLVEAVLATARLIQARERQQAADVRSGRTLRSLLRFDEYLATRSLQPGSTFREHLRAIGGAIEE